MASGPNDRLFQINQKVRELIRKRLPEFEDIFVSIAMDAYREIVQNEPEDPFDCLKGSSIETHQHSSALDDLIYDDEDDEEEEEVSVTTRIFNDTTYYTFLEDEGNTLRGVHERIMNDDNESEVGDLAGYVDDQDRFWKAVKKNGKIEEYTHENTRIPALTNTIMRYPDLDSLNKDR